MDVINDRDTRVYKVGDEVSSGEELAKYREQHPVDHDPEGKIWGKMWEGLIGVVQSKCIDVFAKRVKERYPDMGGDQFLWADDSGNLPAWSAVKVKREDGSEYYMPIVRDNNGGEFALTPDGRFFGIGGNWDQGRGNLQLHNYDNKGQAGEEPIIDTGRGRSDKYLNITFENQNELSYSVADGGKVKFTLVRVDRRAPETIFQMVRNFAKTLTDYDPSAPKYSEDFTRE